MTQVIHEEGCNVCTLQPTTPAVAAQQPVASLHPAAPEQARFQQYHPRELTQAP